MTTKTNVTSRLASAFSRGMRSVLTGRELEDVNADNKKEVNPSICHSHDYVDANDVMVDAFKETFKRAPDTSGGLDVALWNQAWMKAKENNFSL